jgi:hypothetical protein
MIGTQLVSTSTQHVKPSLHLFVLVAIQSYVVLAGPPSICPQQYGCPTKPLDVILNKDACLGRLENR